MCCYAGNVLSSYKSNPFGDGYSASGQDDNSQHYAGQEHDAVSGTEHAQFRQYDSAVGIWMRPDPSAFLYVATEWRVTCRHITPGTIPFIRAATVIQEGVTDENICGRARSESIKGKLIIFTRKASFLENLKR
jgi:RHS repeat-associated protein